MLFGFPPSPPPHFFRSFIFFLIKLFWQNGLVVLECGVFHLVRVALSGGHDQTQETGPEKLRTSHGGGHCVNKGPGRHFPGRCSSLELYDREKNRREILGQWEGVSCVSAARMEA